jgi:hypothetical protein
MSSPGSKGFITKEVINMERMITMSTKELGRAEVFSQLKQRVITQLQASEILGLSVRQIRRLFKAYSVKGPQALISQKRGQPSNHQTPEGIKEWAKTLIQEHYNDFGPTLAHEKLVEVHKLTLSLSTVRSLMIAENIWASKRVKKRRVFQLRERRATEGELIQIDGSPHDWFEGRNAKCSLLCCVDDATGKIKAAFFAPSETVWGYFELMKIYLRAHGRPKAFYSDKHSVFRINRSGALHGIGIIQFGRALKELDIEIIYANTPQAKGRIERSNRTLQDRLVKELRLHKISTLEEANAFLSKFIEGYNRRFSVVPKNPQNAHRSLLPEHNLNLIFTIKEHRQLSKNLTFQYKNTIYQIITVKETSFLRKAIVNLQEFQDGSIQIAYRNQGLKFTTYSQQEKQGEIVDAKALNTAIDNLQETQKKVRRPTYDHPWKRGSRKKLLARLSMLATG